MEQIDVTPNPAGPDAPKDTSGDGTPTSTGDNKDGLILGKYKTQADLENAYKALEAKLGTPAVKKPEEETPTEKPSAGNDEEVTVDDLKIVAKAKSKGIDVDAIADEYRENGEVSEATLSKLDKQGIPREMVEAYVQGQMALAKQTTLELADAVGGKERLGEMLEWAADNLPEDEIAVYNKSLEVGDLAATKVALRGISASFSAAEGNEPDLTGGAEQASRSTGVKPFSGMQAVVNAMKDKRYETDSDYRDEVTRRLGVSTF